MNRRQSLGRGLHVAFAAALGREPRGGRTAATDEGHRRLRAGRQNASMPAVPPDATVSLGYSVKDMPQR